MDNPDQWYNLAEVKSNFNPGTKFFLTFGTWGDSSGFEQASKTPQLRQTYADNVAKILNDQGFDGVDIDWEYPGGHGANYKTHDDPNELKQEITNFPLFLHALRKSIKDKKLSIAVPGKAEDMLAYNKQTAKSIFDEVDYVNIMSYDLTNRRSKATGHLSSVKGSLESAKNYIDLGLDPKKANLGFPFYAEFYKMLPNCTNANGLNCPIQAAENADGSDAKTSGVLTFQKENFAKPPGHIGNAPDFCGMSCMPDYGKCTGVTAVDSFNKAYSKKQLDKEGGGYYAVDTQNNYFWTWDEPEIYENKFNEIVKKLNLGGVMAWSLGQDSNDWSHIKKMIELSNKEFGGQSSPQSDPQSSPQSSPQSNPQSGPQSSPQSTPQSGSPKECGCPA
ncbi:hypothetical protein KEM56_003473 [Ascosphaera pollenicola]|nr:hypothetical protein KEM56_003473 [Ascosphaera pollenicola]